MNFFEHQDRARRSTFWLVVLFVLAVLAIITSVNVAVFGIARLVGDYGRQRPTHEYRSNDYPFTPRQIDQPPDNQIPPWQLFGGVTAATLLVIVGGSLYKTAQLSRGGHVVAQLM